MDDEQIELIKYEDMSSSDDIQESTRKLSRRRKSEDDTDAERQPLASSGRKKGYGISNVQQSSMKKTPQQRRTGLKNYLMFWRENRPGSSSTPRTIHLNDFERNHENRFCSNRISTTKYSLISFFPRFFYDQFRRYANLFFLFIALLQQIPGISPTGRFTTLVPLSLVLLATAVKEIIEDFRRFRADNRVNNSKVEVLRDGTRMTVNWTKVVVGDVVCVENKHFFPADLVLLASSDPQGICYVETSNLDGETNLKIRQAHSCTVDCTSEVQLLSLKGHVECEGPNNRLYEFTGNIRVNPKNGQRSSPVDEQRKDPILPDQVLLRGSQLRNTKWIYGLVVYTGHDSKLLQNATKTPLKRSRMDHVTNKQVIFLFLVLIVLAVVSSLGSSIWNSIHTHKYNHWYLQMPFDAGSQVKNFFSSIFTFIILYNNLVPISLIVTLEIVKFIQTFFINWDQDMYDEASDTPALARNSNLNEELGQVKYVFSDKTGTLTENVMVFKKCSVAGQIYGMEPTDSSEDQYPVLNIREAIKGLQVSPGSQSTLIEFLKVLALCHSVIPEKENGAVVYRASSPDEEALVNAAKELGVVFKARTPNYVIIDVCGKEEKYTLLNLLEFNSTRKRMSVIVRAPDGKIRLLCKGADTVIYSRLKYGESFATKTERHLEYFAVNGLRTLCVADAVIDEKNYEKWSSMYHQASTSLENREKKLDDAAEEIERNLTLLGATAIEDKLQQGVPESIAKLRDAGIKVWVLTGDKQETAINIGYASRQLTQNMSLKIINEETLERVEARVDEFYHECGCHRQDCGVKNVALIIDGKSLAHALNDQVKDHFLKLALSCKSVICCRVSPLQKADVVRLVREKVKDSITLAIGDGANDVSMIQAAHVGVGISGKEGLQATMASDYAIAQFRFLVKLLFVHGVWNYNRLAIVILFSFYKNICLYLIEFWFSFFNGFSGQPLFERWTIGLYNVLFTFIPPITYGLFEQDVSATARVSIPSLYKPSQQGKYFNTRVFWKWVGLAIFHSLVLYLGIYFMLTPETPFDNGKVMGLWYVGNTVYTGVVITVNLKLALESQFWPIIHHISVWGSIALWFLFVLVYSHFWPAFPIAVEMVGQDFKLYASLTFYALFLLAPSISMLPDLIFTVVQKTFFKTEIDKVREREIKKKIIPSEEHPSFDMSVSYSAKDAKRYGDGLDESPESAVDYIPSHGYAFSQEDHGPTRKGSRLQRREMIRMYDTEQGRKT